MITDVTLRAQLDPDTKRELDNLVKRLQGMVSGEFIRVPSTAERFSASSGAWTVNPNFAQVSYMRMGRIIILDFIVRLTTVTATPTELRIALPAGMSHVTAKSAAFAYRDNGVVGTGIARATVAGTAVTVTGTVPGTYVALIKDANLTAWTASAANSAVEGQIALEIRP